MTQRDLALMLLGASLLLALARAVALPQPQPDKIKWLVPSHN